MIKINDYMAFLNDNNEYYLDSRSIVETVCNAQHGDWKTAYVKDIEPIPKGTQLKVVKIWSNFYGKWVQVLYEGRHYDLRPRDLKYIGRE